MKSSKAYQKLQKTILDNFQLSSIKLNNTDEMSSSFYPIRKSKSKTSSKQLNDIKLTQIRQLQQSQQNQNRQSLSQSVSNFSHPQSVNKKIDTYNRTDFPSGFKINGINYFTQGMPLNQNAEVVQDCYSVKGDYFYLKKGQIIKIRSKISEYAEIKYQRFVGYFPIIMFKFIKG